MSNTITFQKLIKEYQEFIFSWLAEPHVQEFWDNTQAHKDDILNFIDGRKEPFSYCDGNYTYWLAIINDEPYAMLMTIPDTYDDDIDQLLIENLSKTGNTYSIDYMIGNTKYFGKGYGAQTLMEFVDFFRAKVDSKADAFLIDPAKDNPRAKRVYEKAGFEYIADFLMQGEMSGSGKQHHLLIKKYPPLVSLQLAELGQYSLVQNMARSYALSLSKDCETNDDFDFKNYFTEESRKAYLIKVYSNIAGFVLVNQATFNKNSNLNIGEFFVLDKYQRLGLGRHAA